MTKHSKYSYKIEQNGSIWTAQINRQITSKKTVVSNQKNDFACEADATQWAKQQLTEFATTLSASNKRHGEQRKLSENERKLRSERRSEKTQLAKQNDVNGQQEFTNPTENE